MPIRRRAGTGLFPSAGSSRLTAPHPVGRRVLRHRDGQARPGVQTRVGNAPDPTHTRKRQTRPSPVVERHRLGAGCTDGTVSGHGPIGPLLSLVLGYRIGRTAPQQASELGRSDPPSHRSVEIRSDQIEGEQPRRGPEGPGAGSASASRGSVPVPRKRRSSTTDRSREQRRASTPVALQGRRRAGRENRALDLLHEGHEGRDGSSVAAGRETAPSLSRILDRSRGRTST